MKKLKKVSAMLLGIMILAFGCENFTGDDDDDTASDDDDEVGEEESLSDQIYGTVTEAMNKSILAIYLTMDPPVNVPGSNYIVLPDSVTGYSDSSGSVEVDGTYEINIFETTEYNFDLDVEINSFDYKGIVTGEAEITAVMVTTVSEFEYTISYKGSGTHTEDSASNITWDIIYTQDTSQEGAVSGEIIIDGVTHEITDAIAAGVF
jgi:hypothetical protein